LADGEDRLTLGVAGAEISVTPGAERVIQRAGRHADLPGHRLRLQVPKLTLLRADSALPGTVGATPTGRSGAASGPDARRDNDRDVSRRRRLGSSRTASLAAPAAVHL